MSAQPMFHLVDPDEWAATGAAYAPPSLATEGFVHLSFADQAEGSADRHLTDAPQLVALEIDADAAGAEIRVEDSYGSGTAYPHLYGPLPRASVRAEHLMERDAEGHWRFSAGDVSAPPSPGR